MIVANGGVTSSSIFPYVITSIESLANYIFLTRKMSISYIKSKSCHGIISGRRIGDKACFRII